MQELYRAKCPIPQMLLQSFKMSIMTIINREQLISANYIIMTYNLLIIKLYKKQIIIKINLKCVARVKIQMLLIKRN